MKIMALKKFGDNNEKAVFQFILSNSIDTIQICCWNDLAHKYAKLIRDTQMVNIYVYVVKYILKFELCLFLFIFVY